MLYWQGSYFFAVFHMVGIWAMTEFTRNCLVDTTEMHFFDVRVAGETGIVGHVANLSIPFIHYGVTTVMPVFAKRSRSSDHFDYQAQYSRYYKE